MTFLKGRPGIDPKRTGVVGHSEGALIAARLAAESSDPGFIVLSAGPGLPGDTIAAEQERVRKRQAGVSPKAVEFSGDLVMKLCQVAKTDANQEELRRKLKTIWDAEWKQLDPRADIPAPSLAVYEDPWQRWFFRRDPRTDLKRVRCPVLAVTGDKDPVVDAKLHLPEIRAALREAKNPNVTVRELPGLNHFFQTSAAGNWYEHGTLEETFAPSALEAVSGWVLERR